MNSRSFVDTLSPVFAYLNKCSCGRIVLDPQSDEEKNSVINLDAFVGSVRKGSYFMSSSPSLLPRRGVNVPLSLACLCTLSDDSVLVGRGGVFDLFLFMGRGLSSLESVLESNTGREWSEYGGDGGPSRCLNS